MLFSKSDRIALNKNLAGTVGLKMCSNVGRFGDENWGGAFNLRHKKSIPAAGFIADDYRRFFLSQLY
jgi:hypothetical protein